MSIVLRHYAGIGSRRTPRGVLAFFRGLGEALARDGWHLRSGHADGADKAFEAGAAAGGGSASLYLPRRGWNGPLYQGPGEFIVHTEVTTRAIALARRHHPAARFLRPGGFAESAHARNCYRILDAALDSPVAFVLCWTPDGAERAADTSRVTGGTGRAIRVADAHGMPVLNFHNEDARYRLSALLATLDGAG